MKRLALLLALSWQAVASAQTPITDRNYALEFHQGAVIGGSRVIGMGGATVAVGEGAMGMPRNAASAGVRAATSRGRWDWDWNVNWLYPQLGSDDFDNNGNVNASIDETLIATGGLVIYRGKWAFGFSIDYQQHTVTLEGSQDLGLPQVGLSHLVVARSFADEQLVAGIGFRSGQLIMSRRDQGSTEQELFRMSGAAPELGVVWRPCVADVRVGGSVAAPLVSIGGEIAPSDYRPEDYGGYILPEKLVVPWEATAGVGYRFGPTRWNQRVATEYRDERALIVAADLVLTGATKDGHGIEAFVDKQLQPAGEEPVLSVRGGAEIEAIPGWLRIRAGSYYEPSRFAGVSGRVHATAGIDGRLFSFCLWGDNYRVRLSVTGDRARRYGNFGVSVGFWH